jgi:mRNA interferase YafQ
MTEPKYHIRKSSKFKSGYKLAKKQGRDLSALAWGVSQLAWDIPLPPNWKDHQLKGNYKHFRECHIDGAADWLLVYEKRETDMILYLLATGSHADLL